jgi:hypothetical protein
MAASPPSTATSASNNPPGNANRLIGVSVSSSSDSNRPIIFIVTLHHTNL